MDFGTLFQTFSTTAFRLECLPEYRIPGELLALKHYEETGTLPADSNTEWVGILRTAKARQARVERLRLVSSPLTQYERFEVEAAYVPGLRLGEDIRLAPRDTLPDSEDFWVFDDDWYAEMIYSPASEFIRAEIRQVDTELSAKVQYWRRLFHSGGAGWIRTNDQVVMSRLL